MTRRKTGKERREQVVAATLELLSETPIDQISTRQIARAVGLTQPALFRHFRSRDAILREVVAAVRERFAALATELLEQNRAPAARLRALAAGLCALVEENPGVPRLLFHDPGGSEGASFQPPLAHLVSMQESLVAELLRELQRDGDVDEGVDAEEAARLFVALVQGVLLQWEASGRAAPLARRGAALVEFWLAATAAGQPARIGGEQAPEQAAPDGLMTLDVRPILASGRDPLADVLGALERLADDGALLLTAPFAPRPLVALLGGRGYRTAVSGTDGVFEVEILAAGAPDPLELRELEAPGPLEAVLAASAELEVGAALIARVPRIPRMLLPHLDERGLGWTVVERSDGSALLHLRRAP